MAHLHEHLHRGRHVRARGAAPPVDAPQHAERRCRGAAARQLLADLRQELVEVLERHQASAQVALREIVARRLKTHGKSMEIGRKLVENGGKPAVLEPKEVEVGAQREPRGRSDRRPSRFGGTSASNSP